MVKDVSLTFQYQREEFLAYYHKRSNVESTFSAIKRKFGDSLRSRTDAAMKNEARAKILCHNLVVLIHEMHELGDRPCVLGKNGVTRHRDPGHRFVVPDVR